MRAASNLEVTLSKHFPPPAYASFEARIDASATDIDDWQAVHDARRLRNVLTHKITAPDLQDTFTALRTFALTDFRLHNISDELIRNWTDQIDWLIDNAEFDKGHDRPEYPQERTFSFDEAHDFSALTARSNYPSDRGLGLLWGSTFCEYAFEAIARRFDLGKQPWIRASKYCNTQTISTAEQHAEKTSERFADDQLRQNLIGLRFADKLELAIKLQWLSHLSSEELQRITRARNRYAHEGEAPTVEDATKLTEEVFSIAEALRKVALRHGTPTRYLESPLLELPDVVDQCEPSPNQSTSTLFLPPFQHKPFVKAPEPYALLIAIAVAIAFTVVCAVAYDKKFWVQPTRPSTTVPQALRNDICLANSPRTAKCLFLDISNGKPWRGTWREWPVIVSQFVVPLDSRESTQLISKEWATYGNHRASLDTQFDRAIVLIGKNTKQEDIETARELLRGPLRESATSGNVVPALEVVVASADDPSLKPQILPAPQSSPQNRDPSLVVRVGTLITSGRLPYNAILSTIIDNKGNIARCYDNALKRNPQLMGRLDVRFVIGNDGSASRSSIGESTLRESDLQDCIIASFERLTFPAPSGPGIVTVLVPLTLSISTDARVSPRAPLRGRAKAL